MATIGRSYDFTGPSAATLAKLVQAELTVTERCTGSVRLIITYDDVADGALASVDEQMAILGFYPSAGVESQLLMQSPDGSEWIITVSDLGVLTVTAE